MGYIFSLSYKIIFLYIVMVGIGRAEGSKKTTFYENRLDTQYYFVFS